MALWFAWNEAKAETNLRKHGVSFDTAKLVFGDAFALSDQDRVEDGEFRWRTIGKAGSVILFVAHTVVDHSDGDETIRIISARVATAAERKRYEQERLRER